ncbi:DUF6855 family protein [Dactylosporangium sp. NPDC005555]|uniref:DUF6855 family protein n=1 Tax=Dactylosporangium sp. NPDC005555 TaxID=3154889 RepID=UPI00339F6F42
MGAADGTVDAWGRSPETPSAAGTGYRGRFGMELPPLLEELGLAGLTRDARGNRIRARCHVRPFHATNTSAVP